MSQGAVYTEDEANRSSAIDLNGKTWAGLDKADRIKEEDELMVYSAFGSCRHWMEAGTGVHHQRGEWLISRVYAVLGLGDAALRHANRCLELTNQYADEMQDFDWAFAYEGFSRANAVAGNREAALRHIGQAEAAGEAIEDPEGKEIFLADFGGGDRGNVR
jgi:hypothetical protein